MTVLPMVLIVVGVLLLLGLATGLWWQRRASAVPAGPRTVADLVSKRAAEGGFVAEPSVAPSPAAPAPAEEPPAESEPPVDPVVAEIEADAVETENDEPEVSAPAADGRPGEPVVPDPIVAEPIVAEPIVAEPAAAAGGDGGGAPVGALGADAPWRRASHLSPVPASADVPADIEPTVDPSPRRVPALALLRRPLDSGPRDPAPAPAFARGGGVRGLAAVPPAPPAEPAAAEPAAAEPAVAEPASAEPAVAEPAAAEPAVAEPAAAEPAVAERGVEEPAAAEPAAAESAAAEPAMADPVLSAPAPLLSVLRPVVEDRPHWSVPGRGVDRYEIEPGSSEPARPVPAFPAADPDVLFDAPPVPEPAVPAPVEEPPGGGITGAVPTDVSAAPPIGMPITGAQAAEEPAADLVPAADPADAEQPAEGTPAIAEPVVGRSVDPRATPEPPTPEPPAPELPAADGPAAEPPAADGPAAEPPAADGPAADAPATDPPAAESVVDPGRTRRDPARLAAEQAAADLALLRTFGSADLGSRPDRAPVVALEGCDRPGSEPPEGSAQPVRFRIVRRDGAAIPGAAVALLDDRGHESSTGRSDAAGAGELRAPHPGGYVLVATAPEHQPGAVALTVGDGPVDADVLLVRSASLVGTVTGEDGPIAGARITLVQDGEMVDSAESGADGGYAVADMAAGEYALSVAAAGCEPHVVLVVMPDEAELVHDVELQPAGVPAG